jgi:hypothetical protein
VSCVSIITGFISSVVIEELWSWLAQIINDKSDHDPFVLLKPSRKSLGCNLDLSGYYGILDSSPKADQIVNKRRKRLNGKSFDFRCSGTLNQCKPCTVEIQIKLPSSVSDFVMIK